MEVKLSWYLHPRPLREPNLGEEKPLLGQGNCIAREKAAGKVSAKVRKKLGQSLGMWAKLTLSVKLQTFLTDTRETYSVVNRPLTEL